ncbi:NAD(P)/FAD-dependent oxidoreductase [Kangiella sediminilitoris]|uniref:Tryptophan halogenase n=1 Tax=Kangiella sediminilitoris TaxID=1144748 RepID=A0A1B3BDZ2_9GAMM|nr:NAD(P)/FAD-dependent oxidoreductase [Kangiella sediminilitoris]AOE50983.1 Tryptophan halogenase [Kangiella sediminilitoris]
MNRPSPDYDVIIIGAGPAGSLASSLLVQQGYSALVIEKETFPRFSIGESLLPQSMIYLEEAKMLKAVEEAAESLGFQYKNGAAFIANDQYSDFNFSEKFSAGPGHTYQVKRAHFDQLLANEAENQGADFKFGCLLTSLQLEPEPVLTIQTEKGISEQLTARFILDASGFARVLPRLLDLSQPSDFPVRSSVFCHIKDNISDTDYDRNKILIETHPELDDVWFWLIPFSDGTSSLGCVAKPEYFEQLTTADTPEALLDQAIAETSRFQTLLASSTKTSDTRQVTGFSSNVKQLYGRNFALLGNAGEFLDPIFSSGVTIAFKSAKLATDILNKQFTNQPYCWQTEFAEPLQQGVNTFKAFVNSWYQGDFQNIIHFKDAPTEVREMICSILAGYAWDKDNPFVQQPERRLQVVGGLCAS